MTVGVSGPGPGGKGKGGPKKGKSTAEKRKEAELLLERLTFPAPAGGKDAAEAGSEMAKQPPGATPCGKTEELPTFDPKRAAAQQKKAAEKKARKEREKPEEAEAELVSLTVVRNADRVAAPEGDAEESQSGDGQEEEESRTWAAIVWKKQVPLVGLEHAGGEKETLCEEELKKAFEAKRWVVVEAAIFPDLPRHRKKVQWSGGEPVPPEDGKEMLLRRRVSRDAPAHHHIEAKLGGKTLALDIWVVWADLTIVASGERPKNALAFGELGNDVYDGTQELGAKVSKAKNGTMEARGKVVPVAKLSPPGVHEAVKTGWSIWRVVQAHVFVDGEQATSETFKGAGHSDKWWRCPKWVYDKQHTRQQKLVPDEEDQIYDRDAPNVGDMGGLAKMDSEIYYNFVQWVEWGFPSGAGGICSDWKEWHFHGRWERHAPAQITFAECATGHEDLPDDSVLHPRRKQSG